jgi:hypothetical protein
MSAQYVLWAVGIIQILRYRKRAREAMPRGPRRLFVTG